MSIEIFKRILSSLILIPISVIIILEGNIIFNIFLIFLFLISLWELSNITINKFLFYLSFTFILISFLTIYYLRNYDEIDYLNLFNFFFILTICISTDIGGYAFGKLFKGPKLTNISPNKTISGSIGAFILSFIISYLYLNYIQIFLNYSKTFSIKIFIIIFFISAVSQIGDIFVSYLKRSSKKKDTGNLIPGHGGLLDRIDGMLFAFPFSSFFIFYNIL
jgi:phosphatidate cytidylyltransferase